MRSTLTYLALGAVLTMNTAFATVIYDAPNVTLTGVPNSLQSLTIALGSVPAAWNTLKFSVASFAQTGGTNDAVPGSWAVLGSSSSATFPLIARLNSGDPFPSAAAFGSGSMVFWGFGLGSGDGNFFAPLELGAPFDNYHGWVHIDIQGTSTATPTITILEWAYGDAGERLAMGQLPEPGTAAAMGLGLAIVLAISLQRRKFQHTRLRAE
jgi:hypothetical protein